MLRYNYIFTPKISSQILYRVFTVCNLISWINQITVSFIPKQWCINSGQQSNRFNPVPAFGAQISLTLMATRTEIHSGNSKTITT